MEIRTLYSGERYVELIRDEDIANALRLNIMREIRKGDIHQGTITTGALFFSDKYKLVLEERTSSWPELGRGLKPTGERISNSSLIAYGNHDDIENARVEIKDLNQRKIERLRKNSRRDCSQLAEVLAKF